MPSISVSSLELYRTWRQSEGLDLEWLLRRLRGEEPQTEPMKAGEALHKVFETADLGELMNAEANGYKFYFLCECAIELPTVRELSFEKQYGELTVRGRVDALSAKTVTDYKSTGQFDADRLLEGFQWRYYLSMTGCDTFIWKVFVISERYFQEYEVTQVHELKQHRYPALEDECHQLAADFLQFVRELEVSNISWTRKAVLSA